MKTTLIAFTALASSLSCFATDECANSISKSLQNSDIPALASAFVRTDQTTQRQISDLLSKAGQLSAVGPSAATSLPRFRRYSAHAPDTPSAFSSSAFEMTGRSALLGDIRIQVHLKPGSACSVLAIHIDAGL